MHEFKHVNPVQLRSCNLTRKGNPGDNPIQAQKQSGVPTTAAPRARSRLFCAVDFKQSSLFPPLMKLALLGTDSDVLRLAAAARGLGHEITWLGDLRAEDAAAVEYLAPRLAVRSQEWELLLDGAVADAVLVGRGTAPAELRAEQLKRLAAEAIPLLIVHPVCESVLPYYELDMTRRETGCIVRHYNPMVGHPVVAELAAWVRESHPTIGPIHQLTCERCLDDDGRANVLAYLARDVELAAAAASDIRRVTAIGPRTADASFASLQVQMSTSGPATLRWSVRPSRRTVSGFEMTLIGELGTATLSIDENPSANQPVTWELETLADDQEDRQTLELYDPPGAAIEQLADAIAETNAERRAARSTWDAATRAMEVVDAVELSLEKGRTIDVYQQQLTERLAFRGTMAALGCGLLLVGFVAIVLVSLLGGAEEAVGHRLLPAWPLVLLAVLAFFLVMQVIPLLVHKSKQSASQAARPREDDTDRLR
jgi:hypothetical protein